MNAKTLKQWTRHPEPALVDHPQNSVLGVEPVREDAELVRTARDYGLYALACEWEGRSPKVGPDALPDVLEQKEYGMFDTGNPYAILYQRLRGKP